MADEKTPPTDPREKSRLEDLFSAGSLLTALLLAIALFLFFGVISLRNKLNDCRYEVGRARIDQMEKEVLYAPLVDKARELYPDLEPAEAIALLAKDLKRPYERVLSEQYRDLTSEIRGNIADILGQLDPKMRGGIKIGIAALTGNGHRERFASEMADLLRGGGIVVHGPNNGRFSIEYPGCLVWLSYSGDDRRPAEMMRAALARAIKNDICIIPATSALGDGDNLELKIAGSPSFDQVGTATFQ